jgi:predicted ABC-type ATPase
VKARLAGAREARLATQFRHTIDPGREVWSVQRRVLHDQIINDCHDAARHVPRQRRAIVAGGLPGAGKTTVLRDYAGIDVSQYLVINPDRIKAELATRQLIPGVDGLTPMEAAELVHEESSHIAKRLARLAQAEGRNVIWDVTLSKAESARRRIESLRYGGYTVVEGLFVDSPVNLSVERADARYRDGHHAYRAGVGLGGRFVAEEVIRVQADSAWGSRNRANFEALKRRFDVWSIYDNSGPVPILVAQGSQALDDRNTRDATRRNRQ